MANDTLVGGYNPVMKDMLVNQSFAHTMGKTERKMPASNHQIPSVLGTLMGWQWNQRTQQLTSSPAAGYGTDLPPWAPCQSGPAACWVFPGCGHSRGAPIDLAGQGHITINS